MLIDAEESAMSRGNCATAFQKTGLLPFNKDVVLTNPDYVQNNPGLVPPAQPPQSIQPPLPNAQRPGNPQAQWQQMQQLAHQLPPQGLPPVENMPFKVNNRIYIGEKVLTSDKVLIDLYCEATHAAVRPFIPPYIDFIGQKARVYQANVKNGKMLSQFSLYYIRLPMGGILQLR